jgi:hypothetical protein
VVFLFRASYRASKIKFSKVKKKLVLLLKVRGSKAFGAFRFCGYDDVRGKWALFGKRTFAKLIFDEPSLEGGLRVEYH